MGESPKPKTVDDDESSPHYENPAYIPEQEYASLN